MMMLYLLAREMVAKSHHNDFEIPQDLKLRLPYKIIRIKIFSTVLVLRTFPCIECPENQCSKWCIMQILLSSTSDCLKHFAL